MCHICKTIDELPSLTRELQPGEPEPLLLNVMSGKHNHGPLLIGGADEKIALVQVDDLEWMRQDVKDEILSRFKHQWRGFEPELYALRSSFHEDALRCYSRHNRPKEGCIDYQDDSKLLTPSSWKTEAEGQIDRSDLARITAQTEQNRRPIYLCNFCPVQSYVTFKRREERGQYNRQSGETD